jgi:endonuclease/exonuclease/phosphatase family metal-dependent hydrolase
MTLDDRQLTVGIWNVQWATRNSRKGAFFVEQLAALSEEVICVTEGSSDLLPKSGQTITSHEDYGYSMRPGRRKVILWSRQVWSDVDDKGLPTLPPGRFIAGTTTTSLGRIRFVGVCIPWRDAHVRTGQCNRQPWEDHLSYLTGLKQILLHGDRSIPLVVLGDFNQCIPRSRQPNQVFKLLNEAFEDGFQFATSGTITGAPNLAIDHLAYSGLLRCVATEFVNSHNEDGRPMSDHFGLRVTLAAKRER